MKLRIFLLIALTVITSCKKPEPRTDYIINGTAKGVYNGIRVYLNELNERGGMVAVDTAIVMNESFTFAGKVDEPTLYYLTLQNVNGRIPLMIENNILQLTLDSKVVQNSILEGSESHTLMQEYNTTLNDYKTKIKELGNTYSEAKFLKDSATAQAAETRIDKLNTELYEYPYEFINAHKDNAVVFQVLEPQLRLQNLDFDKIFETYEGLDPAVRDSKTGKSFSAKLNDLKVRVERAKATQIGAIASDFTAPGPSGDMITLSDVYKKNQYTLIDFWAAWCGPCRRENPNIVSVYNTYRSKGMGIIGVSLDGSRTQQNPKEAWIKAIETDKLDWTQVSNLQYFGPIAQQYNVSAIPASFLVDSNGTIIAKNLRGPALQRKMEELLGN